MREGEQILIILLATHTFFQNKVSRTKIIILILKACIYCKIRWKKNGRGIKSKKLENIKLQ